MYIAARSNFYMQYNVLLHEMFKRKSVKLCSQSCME